MSFLERWVFSDPSFGWFELFVFAWELLALSTIPSVLLRRRGRPKAALSWLLSLFAVPMVGVIAWWAVGRTSIERKQKRRYRAARAFADRHGAPHSEVGTYFEGMVAPEAIGDSIFPSSGNRVEMLFDGPMAYPRMEADIVRARERVHALFYIWRDDRTGRHFRDLLVEKAREGVAVRVLVDAWGSPKFTKRFARPLKSAGAQVAAFMPSKLYPLRAPRFNFVNHRKILVIDQQVAFTGGMNIGDEYANDWHDMMVRITGPAVRALEHVLLDDWNFATKEVVPHIEHERSPPCGDVDCAVIASGPDREAWIHDTLFIAMTLAKSRIWVITPYFIPSLALLTALRTAATRGIDVRILVPATSDVPIVKWASRSYYPELLRSGVRIYEYRKRMIHAKAFIIDDDLSSVGSANVDTRSFRLSFEAGCFFHDATCNRTLVTWFETLLADSTSIALDAFEARSTHQKLLESTAHLLSPLL